MVELKIIEEVTDELMQEIVYRIVEVVDPEKIILFGSYAHGEIHKHSDLDILVIMESPLPRYKRSLPVYDAICGLLFPIDVLVYTPCEVEDWKNVPEAFITTAVRTGRVLYEKQNRSC
ncbi:MAG: nucleotidyltransferase domain-containing protein [bacterium]